jgi:cytochrome P450
METAMTAQQTTTTAAKIIPAVPGRPIIGSLREFQRNPLGFSLEVGENYGDIARVTMLGEESIFVNDPDAIQHVLQTNSRNYDKQTMDYQLLYPLVGQGLLTSVADLPRLPYTRMALQEALRLYPPAWSIARRAIENDELAGYPIPAGSVVHISLYALHRHPRLWDAPDAFRPERFDEAEVEKRHKFAYLPFSAGPRKCIGDQFAMTEGQLILATVAQRFDLTLAPGQRIDTAALITLNPKHGMRMIPQGRR